MLELAADLRLLDEPADHLGLVAEWLAQHLDGQVAAQVDVAPPEHDAHAAAGDLAEELEPLGRSVQRRDDPGRRRLPGGHARSGFGVAGRHLRYAADRLGECGQDAQFRRAPVSTASPAASPRRQRPGGRLNPNRTRTPEKAAGRSRRAGSGRVLDIGPARSWWSLPSSRPPKPPAAAMHAGVPSPHSIALRPAAPGSRPRDGALPSIRSSGQPSLLGPEFLFAF